MIQSGHAMIAATNGENVMMTKVDPFYEYILKSLKKRRRKNKVEENHNG
jgi:hypothetical protein